jgi:hypothetical protein
MLLSSESQYTNVGKPICLEIPRQEFNYPRMSITIKVGHLG